jgi:hypothetical protein
MRADWIVGGALLAAVVMVGCGDDDDAGDPCPTGVEPGGAVTCSCGDAASPGMQMCGEDKKLTACKCPDESSTGSGGANAGSGGTATMSSGTGGAGGKGGGTSGSGGSGGDAEDGGTAQKDAGSTPDDTTPPPMDGNQLSLCETGVDCNRGLDCYNPAGGGDGFCTKPCETADDCMGIAGAAYTCSMSTQLCVIDCDGEDDTSCPDGMRCLVNGFGGGGQGQQAASYRCEYPAMQAANSGGAWEECSSPNSDDCAMGLTCNGSGAAASGSGFCAQRCTNNNECTMMPGSGSIMPTCEGGGMGGPGMGTGGANRTCVLDCSDDADGCPDGMTCVENRFLSTSRCEFE